MTTERQPILEPEPDLRSCQRRVDRSGRVVDLLAERRGTQPAPEIRQLLVLHPPAGADPVHFDPAVDRVARREGIQRALTDRVVVDAQDALEIAESVVVARVELAFVVEIHRRRGRRHQPRIGVPRQVHHAQPVDPLHFRDDKPGAFVGQVVGAHRLAARQPKNRNPRLLARMERHFSLKVGESRHGAFAEAVEDGAIVRAACGGPPRPRFGARQLAFEQHVAGRQAERARHAKRPARTAVARLEDGDR